MVHAALQSGNPSMGGGAGNGAVYIDHTAFLDRAVEDILLSKRFDNSMVCATENSAVVEAPIYDKWLQMIQDKGAYLVPKKDYQKLADFVFNDKHGVNGPVAGMSARWICEHAGVTLSEGKDVLLFELDPKNIGEKLSSEKLSPLLSVYKAKDREDGIRIVKALLDYQGAGHNAAIQIGSQNDPFIDEYGKAVQASRVLVNQPEALGGIGDIFGQSPLSKATPPAACSLICRWQSFWPLTVKVKLLPLTVSSALTSPGSWIWISGTYSFASSLTLLAFCRFFLKALSLYKAAVVLFWAKRPRTFSSELKAARLSSGTETGLSSSSLNMSTLYRVLIAPPCFCHR